jgi:putative glutamine amidotransferase
VTRPVIGLCAALERASWNVWEGEVMLLSRSYVDAVQAAGALAVMLPPDPFSQEDPDQVLDLLDGLLLCGGADVDPDAYGAPRDKHTGHTVPERDAFEIALALRALERDLPVLGICRGMQVLNVARGGTLIQHLPDDLGHHDHRRRLGTFDESDHDVELVPGSLIERVAGETVHATKSHHHQGVDRLGAGWVISGRATMDDLPEAIEDPLRGFALGVQWHPEVDATSPVVAALVEEARARMGVRVGAGAGRRAASRVT